MESRSRFVGLRPVQLIVSVLRTDDSRVRVNHLTVGLPDAGAPPVVSAALDVHLEASLRWLRTVVWDAVGTTYFVLCGNGRRTVWHVARITVEVNTEWLDAAREVLGTDTAVATIDAALRAFALHKQAVEIIAAFDRVPINFTDSGTAWRYDGGRDLSLLDGDARAAGAVRHP
ncbi:MAG TPA: hypothetical protein VGR21_07305 [Cryptosporangiaceae bacterium]|nr:hypothetical protein [Cryptosporangiaceae bacterium]